MPASPRPPLTKPPKKLIGGGGGVGAAGLTCTGMPCKEDLDGWPTFFVGFAGCPLIPLLSPSQHRGCPILYGERGFGLCARSKGWVSRTIAPSLQAATMIHHAQRSAAISSHR